MAEKSQGKKLQEKLSHKWQNAWNKSQSTDLVMSFNEEYKNFLDKCKTERESVKNIIRMAEENGYISIEEVISKNEKLKPGAKLYANNKGKSVALFVMGKEELSKGMNIVGSHIDSPRIDVKQFPLYEDSELALLKTHYYGGIKKYQWVSQPLALHGVVMKSDGEKVEISIGEQDDEPVFMITDLLIHLAKDQMGKKLSEGVTGEGLNILIGSIPYKDEELSDKVKLNVLNILNEKYGISEEDFATAELEAVPAGKARDLGLDRSLIVSYGHDDRVCAYTSMKAIFELDAPNKTSVALFADKEEIGSFGNTGMKSRFFEYMVSELIALTYDSYSDLLLKRAMNNSRVLSADVAAAFDPNYPEVLDKRNAAYIGKGVAVVKYTGARGKAGCNDANAEFVGDIRRIFNENDVAWQLGELGKVDQGGGGTIAYMLANYGMEVLDCGVPVLSMHAPYEVVSKADVYEAYKAYKAFYFC